LQSGLIAHCEQRGTGCCVPPGWNLRTKSVACVNGEDVGEGVIVDASASSMVASFSGMRVRAMMHAR
jgi:hypothetical protein